MIGGIYKEDTGECFEMLALKKICLKVALKYVDDLPPVEAEVVSNVALTTGCFDDGNAGFYEQIALVQDSASNEYKVDFTDVTVEVRHDKDPYTIYTAIASNDSFDLSLFFWLSMGCLLFALVLIIWLGIYYSYYISVE